MAISFFEKLRMDKKSLSARKKKLGGSEINIIASRNKEKIHNLFLEKTDQKEPDDLTLIWPVIMGHITETVNLEWTEHYLQTTINMRQQVIEGNKNPFMRCTLDGVIENYKNKIAVIDAKFTLGRPVKDEAWGDVIPRLIRYYAPQLHWNAYLLQEYLDKPVEYGLLSFIRGGDKPILEEMQIDTAYQEELIELGKYFMNCVDLGFEPDEIPTTTDFVPQADLVPVDMESDDRWRSFALQIIQTAGANKIFKESSDNIKKLVPPNASEATGHGVKIKVQRNGSKRLEICKN